MENYQFGRYSICEAFLKISNFTVNLKTNPKKPTSL